MGLRQGIGLLALLAVQVSRGEDYDDSSRLEQHIYHSHNHHYHCLSVEQEPVQLHI